MGNFLAQDTNTIRVLQGQLGRDFEKNYNSFLTLDKAFFSDFTAFDLTPKGKMKKKIIYHTIRSQESGMFSHKECFPNTGLFMRTWYTILLLPISLRYISASTESEVHYANLMLWFGVNK